MSGDGSRGTIRAPARLRGHRAASPSGLSRFASSLSGIGWRGALLDYAGVIFTILFAALVLMA
jgi:hypothetical protein